MVSSQRVRYACIFKARIVQRHFTVHFQFYNDLFEAPDLSESQSSNSDEVPARPGVIPIVLHNNTLIKVLDRLLFTKFGAPIFFQNDGQL